MTTATKTLNAKIDTLTELLTSIDATSRGGLDTVQALRMIRETAESALRQAIPQALSEGATWEQIGRALAVTRQSAHERYSG